MAVLARQDLSEYWPSGVSRATSFSSGVWVVKGASKATESCYNANATIMAQPPPSSSGAATGGSVAPTSASGSGPTFVSSVSLPAFPTPGATGTATALPTQVGCICACMYVRMCVCVCVCVCVCTSVAPTTASGSPPSPPRAQRAPRPLSLRRYATVRLSDRFQLNPCFSAPHIWM